MEIRQLRQFVAVVETGNVSNAAAILHLTQPALTRTIKSLEIMLKTELLERHPRGVIPTDAGKNLYSYAKLILNETDRAKREILSIANGFQGNISIGCASLFANQMIADVLARIVELYPGLNVRVQEGFFENLVSSLERAEIDLIVCNFPLTRIPPQLKLEPLINVHSHFVVGRGHRLAKRRAVSAEDLYDEHWALSRNAHVVDFIDQFLAKAGLLSGPGSVETSSLNILKALVLTGRFVSVLAEHWIADELRTGDIVALNLPGTPLVRPAGIILRDVTHQRPPVRKIIEIIREVYARPGSEKPERKPRARSGAK
jgi:DNA-binding transcriptional LysR family regulator